MDRGLQDIRRRKSLKFTSPTGTTPFSFFERDGWEIFAMVTKVAESLQLLRVKSGWGGVSINIIFVGLGKEVGIPRSSSKKTSKSPEGRVTTNGKTPSKGFFT